jgi:hypothetical protein
MATKQPHGQTTNGLHEHEHSHSSHQHSHSHGEDGLHSHGAAQVIQALQGKGAC